MPTAKKKDKEEGTNTVSSGVYMFPNGDKYEGEYCLCEDSTPERNGRGVHSTSDGTVYTGAWTADKMNGQGHIVYASGASYEGDFVNNQFHGKGKYTWPNGSYYVGDFMENKMQGDGEFTDTEGQQWTGIFRNKAAPGLRFKINL